MLPPGLYEQVINTALNCKLSEITDARKSVAPFDKAEAFNTRIKEQLALANFLGYYHEQGGPAHRRRSGRYLLGNS